jgi:hypothetical protein
LQKIIGKQAIQIEILKKNGRAIYDKVEAVNSLKGAGYSVKAACEALGVPRSSYYASLQRNPTPEGTEEHENTIGNDGSAGNDRLRLLEEIKAIKVNHPFWGYRRVTAYLRHRKGINVEDESAEKPHLPLLYGIIILKKLIAA